MKRTVDCIIPFYNEGDRVVSVIGVLARVPSIARIICVDDGSTDGAGEELKKKFSTVVLIRLNQNLGKASAVLAGLQRATSDSVLLFDADLAGIRPREIDRAIRVFQSRPDIDMIILRRIGDPWVHRLMRTDIVISGQRLIRRRDLEHMQLARPGPFQLELAINSYMRDTHKQTGWMSLHYRDVYKREKHGFLRGTLREFAMYRDLLFYRTPVWYILHLASFCRRKIR